LPLSIESSYPISHKQKHFAKEKGYAYGTELINNLKQKDFFSVRLGELSFKGWKLKKTCYDSQGQFTVEKLSDDCFIPDIQQKGVDIKIGLDIAWASYEHIVKRILLVTGDSDFVPAIKTARRNNVFVFLYTLGHGVMKELLDNADVTVTEGLENFIN
jgi:uncharacterized LabA/DUF88 family protein